MRGLPVCRGPECEGSLEGRGPRGTSILRVGAKVHEASLVISMVMFIFSRSCPALFRWELTFWRDKEGGRGTTIPMFCRLCVYLNGGLVPAEVVVDDGQVT